MNEEAKSLLNVIATETSLRYALHLLSLSAVAARKRKVETVELEDVKRVYSLFLDVERSAKYLDEYQNEFLYSQPASAISRDVLMT